MNEILTVLLIAVFDMTSLPLKPDYEFMNTAQMKEDMCVHPEASNCKAYPAIHPPKTNRVIINTDYDLVHDLSAQGAVVHVLAEAAMEKSGMVSPDMPCSRVGQLHIKADQIQEAYLIAVSQEYIKAGKKPPVIYKQNTFPMFCTPDAVMKLNTPEKATL